MVKPIVKPAVVQVARPIPTATKPMHPLEQRFMERMMGQKPTPMKPVGVVPPPKPLVHPMTPGYGTPPPTKITPPSAFPTFTASAAKPAQKPVKPAAHRTEQDMPTLDLSIPGVEEESAPQIAPSRSMKAPPAKKQPVAVKSPVATETMDLGFDIGKAEESLSPEKRKEIEFEAIMDRFKNVVTTQQKLLAYEFADEIGITDHIEEFYEFLNHPDKDGIIVYKGDQVKINKTKIMGALMLGDNSILDRVMTNFRVWLVKVLK